MLFVRIARGAGAVALIALIATALLWPQLSGTVRADNTGFRSPAATHAPNQWTAPDRAFTDNEIYATETTDADAQGYSDFGLSVPAGAIILGIAVTLDAFSSDATGCEIDVALSGNGGGAYSSTRTADLTDTETVHAAGGSSDLWVETWTASMFTDANFVVRVTSVEGADCTGGSTTSLDHLEVNVYYKEITDSGLEAPKLSTAPDDWTDPDNAFTSNNVYATSNVDNDDQGYTDFNLSVPAVSTFVPILATMRLYLSAGVCSSFLLLMVSPRIVPAIAAWITAAPEAAGSVA